jgi:6-phosphofructokinase 1
MSRKFKTADYEATLNSTVTLRDCLPPDHLARFIADVITQLDLGTIYAHYGPRGGEAIVLELHYAYGVSRILGFRYGYAGLTSQSKYEPWLLSPAMVDTIHEHGGTLLGTSRGQHDIGDMVDTLMRWNVGILFVIGGDGTMRGARALYQEISHRKLHIGIIGIPKTIDNDLAWIERSFGFNTAVAEARRIVAGAHAEARGAWNGIGLVKPWDATPGSLRRMPALPVVTSTSVWCQKRH